MRAVSRETARFTANSLPFHWKTACHALRDFMRRTLTKVLDVRNILVIAMLVALSASVSLARPQKGRISWFKLEGRVLDGNGRPIHWGRIYVKDTHAHFLRIKLVDSDGHFKLVDLDARLDYEVYAEQDDLVSEKVLISGSEKTPEGFIEVRFRTKQENH